MTPQEHEATNRLQADRDTLLASLEDLLEALMSDGPVSDVVQPAFRRALAAVARSKGVVR